MAENRRFLLAICAPSSEIAAVEHCLCMVRTVVRMLHLFSVFVQRLRTAPRCEHYILHDVITLSSFCRRLKPRVYEIGARARLIHPHESDLVQLAETSSRRMCLSSCLTVKQVRTPTRRLSRPQLRDLV